MHRVLVHLTLFLLASASQAGVRIEDPISGAYVSGPYDVILHVEGSEEVSQTRLYLDGKEAFVGEGLHEKVELDFGEEIHRHELYAIIRLANGDELTSNTVYTRALEINLVTTSEIILLTAVVRNRRNKTYLDLPRDKFEVFENGRPLDIVSFHNESLPLDLVFLLDTSSSLKVKGVDLVKASAAAFLKELETSDRVSLYVFKDHPVQLETFTTDRKRLLNHIENLEPLGETALFDTLHKGLDDLKGRRRGRKAIVLFTDGRDSVYEEPEDKARLMRRAISRAQNQEVTIFTIGMGKRVHKGALERMALETGGRFHYTDEAADLGRIFADIVADLKHQYVLGVKPQSNRRGFQRIEIKVKQRGAQVHARKGYTRK